MVPAPIDSGEVRVGLGFDRHRLEEGLPLWIGGVEIPSDRGAAAHSDGDVLLHSLIDAHLGAFALGDIGQLFPDHEPEYRGISSSSLVKRTLETIRQSGFDFQITNLDATIHLERPKLAPHRPAIRASLARLLATPEERISLKAKTGEGVGVVGTGVVVEAACILSLRTSVRSPG